MGLYAYYVFVSIYGWIYWSKSYSDEKEFRVSIINMKYGGILLAISSILFVLIAVGLKKYTDSDIVFLDAFTTSLSIVATWMLARKILYHWLVWIVIDSVYIAMYIYKGLYATLILFVVYTIFAVIGYIEWHKKWKIQVTK
jgi:nicotinamide mononucleotide transporter